MKTVMKTAMMIKQPGVTNKKIPTKGRHDYKGNIRHEIMENKFMNNNDQSLFDS